MAIVLDGVGTVNGVTLPTTGFGKVLQVVRATDGTTRSTTSTSFVDVTGMSVTITPQKSTSAILIIATGSVRTFSNTDNLQAYFSITDSSNNAISGAENIGHGSVDLTGAGTRAFRSGLKIIAYSTPATTSAVIYKLRFASASASTTLEIGNPGGVNNTSQLFAIEVSA